MNPSLPRFLGGLALLSLPFILPGFTQEPAPTQEAPVLADAAQEPQVAAKIPQQHKTPDGLIDALYECVSFGPGEECDYERMKTIFLPGCTFVMPPGRGEKRKIAHLEDFFADWRKFIAETKEVKEFGFDERIANRRTDQFGDIAHSYVVFEVRFDADSRFPLARGVDSMQMVRIDGRWWVTSINTQFVRPNTPLPRRFLDEE